MKLIKILNIVLVAAISLSSTAFGQVVISASHGDQLSKEAYSEITKNYIENAMHSMLQRAATSRLNQLQVAYNNELTTIAPKLLTNKESFKKFCSEISVAYVNHRFPIILSDNSDPRGKINEEKRKLLKTSLDHEADRIEDYLDLQNPISQGKRIFLILSSLEKAMKTTLY